MAHKIRTVTVNISLTPDKATWAPALARAFDFLAVAKQKLGALGAEVQTIRIATNSFQEYCCCDTEATVEAGGASGPARS